MNSTWIAENENESLAQAAPHVLATFNRRHLRQFLGRFLTTLRASGNSELVVPVAVGLYPSERQRLARICGVAPVFGPETNEHVAKRRLRWFAEIARALPPKTPIAYWDAGDVLFQSRLLPLWELVRANPGKLLAVCEPRGLDYLVNDAWTDSITNARVRREVQQIINPCPFINSGFLAGTADVLVNYFDTVANWYVEPKLAGSTDPGDQLALNVYCHRQPEIWHEVAEGWNYCLWGRSRTTYHRCKDGRYVDVRGAPVYVVHGNARSFEKQEMLRGRF